MYLSKPRMRYMRQKHPKTVGSVMACPCLPSNTLFINITNKEATIYVTVQNTNALLWVIKAQHLPMVIIPPISWQWVPWLTILLWGHWCGADYELMLLIGKQWTIFEKTPVRSWQKKSWLKIDTGKIMRIWLWKTDRKTTSERFSEKLTIWKWYKNWQ